MGLPTNPFWNFSLALYARPGVADACLHLQDEYDLDVNLVLFFIWAGLQGPGKLTAEEISLAISRGQRWQVGVVARIRAVRRQLKLDEMGADPEQVAVFRPMVQALELQGEQVEQLFLGAMVPVQRGVIGRSHAQANLDAYLNWAGIHAAPPVADVTATIVDQACAMQDAAGA